jgi:hypothetical protein
MLMANPRSLTSTIWCEKVNLALSFSIVIISDDFFFENKTRQVPQ